MIFPSDEWAKRFAEELNSNKEYAEASKEWEGSFLFIVNPGPRLDKEFVLFLDLWHGTCRGFAILPNRDSKKADFIYEGTLENWEKLVKGEVDPVQALLSRKFKLTGSMLKILGNVAAASELAKNCSRVPTEFR